MSVKSKHRYLFQLFCYIGAVYEILWRFHFAYVCIIGYRYLLWCKSKCISIKCKCFAMLLRPVIGWFCSPTWYFYWTLNNMCLLITKALFAKLPFHVIKIRYYYLKGDSYSLSLYKIKNSLNFMNFQECWYDLLSLFVIL